MRHDESVFADSVRLQVRPLRGLTSPRLHYCSAHMCTCLVYDASSENSGGVKKVRAPAGGRTHDAVILASAVREG